MNTFYFENIVSLKKEETVLYNISKIFKCFQWSKNKKIAPQKSSKKKKNKRQKKKGKSEKSIKTITISLTNRESKK